jgi:hypothetical protein
MMTLKYSARIIVLAALVWICISLKIPALSSQTAQNKQQAAADELDSYLKKMAAYCLRLESVAFDFVCLEAITEEINPALDVKLPESLHDWAFNDRERRRAGFPSSLKKIKNSYIYDYQCVRAKQQIREIRTLLEENGKKTNEPNAELKTSVVVYGRVLISPVNIFGERFQPYYDYKIIGEDKINKRPVVIIDAVPKPGVPERKNPHGKAWVDAQTSDILKIEWSEKYIGRYDIFEQRGERYKRKPRLTIASEFNTEKNGIRFPSSLFIEEAYVNDRGRAFVRSKTNVVYKEFKFFTVEVEVK